MTFLQPLLLGALAVSAVPTSKSGLPHPRPLVFWHGLGDSYNAPGMVEIQELVGDMYPGIFTHSVYMDEDGEKDREATFYGNVNEQVAFAAEQLANITELEHGFDAIGFSQGGQFLRAYVERHNAPPVHNLITFGAQHMGISDIPGCRPWDLLCRAARQAAKGAVYGRWAQENVVQAQYFRDVANLPTYLEANEFLTSINNERPDSRNATYAQRLASLRTLVLVQFTQDRTVIPKESAWFGSEVIEDGDEVDEDVGGQEVLSFSSSSGASSRSESERTIVPMRLHPIYQQDWIGLRALDQRGAIVFAECEGEHMQLGDCWRPLVEKYAGGAFS